MIIILSPTKIFREYEEEQLLEYKPLKYKEQTDKLVERLAKLKVEELEKLMKVSKKIALCNYERFTHFNEPQQKGYYAADYFYGEAFKGLDTLTLSESARAYMKDHLKILSGLYGSIGALEVIQPYRLEMGTRLSATKGDSLYNIWKSLLTEEILAQLAHTEKEQVLINLASDEYSKALDLKQISKSYPVINLHFKVKKGEEYKVIGMHAKRARGLMARFICKQQIQEVEQIKNFNMEGYSYSQELSEGNNWFFIKE